MSRKLENFFNECLERVLRGESIEACLKSYPKEAAKLEPLLKIASQIHETTASVEPRLEFKWKTRLHLQGVLLYLRQKRQLKPKERVSFGGWQRSWALATTIILIVLIVSAGTAAAATESLPGQPLYPVKLATEQIRLAVAFSDADKAKLHTQFAERRAWEIAEVGRRGKAFPIAKATERLANHLEEVSCCVARVIPGKLEAQAVPSPTPKVTVPQLTSRPDQAAELKKLLEESAPRSIAALELALERAPESAKPALRQAIEMSKKRYQKMLREMEERGKAPPQTPSPGPKIKNLPPK